MIGSGDITEKVRDALNRRGWDLRTYRPFWDLVPKFGFDLVLDVGANRGQFGSTLRRLGYRGQIVSFEPQAKAFADLQAICAGDLKWTALKMALGKERQTLDLRVYEADDFSSFLELRGDGPKFKNFETVDVQTLDMAAADFIAKANRTLLKIDTQGYEREVLEGARHALSDVHGLLLEVCLVPHYEGQWVLEDVFSYCRRAGFVPYTMRRGYFADAQDVEYDVLFLREGLSGVSWATKPGT